MGIRFSEENEIVLMYLPSPTVNMVWKSKECMTAVEVSLTAYTIAFMIRADSTFFYGLCDGT